MIAITLCLKLKLSIELIKIVATKSKWCLLNFGAEHRGVFSTLLSVSMLEKKRTAKNGAKPDIETRAHLCQETFVILECFEPVGETTVRLI